MFIIFHCQRAYHVDNDVEFGIRGFRFKQERGRFESLHLHISPFPDSQMSPSDDTDPKTWNEERGAVCVYIKREGLLVRRGGGNVR